MGIVEENHVNGDRNDSDCSESETVQNHVAADSSRGNEGEGTHTNVAACETEIEASLAVEGEVAGSHDRPAVSHDPEEVQIDMNDES